MPCLSQVFALNCSVTAYCFDFCLQVWTSSDKKRPGFGAAFKHLRSTRSLVLHMLDRVSEVGKSYILVTDRYFTSVNLLRDLIKRGHHLIGTIKSGRGIAKELFWSKNGKRARWDMQFMRSYDMRILFQSWQDRGSVHIITDLYVGILGSAVTAAMTAAGYIKQRLRWILVDGPTNMYQQLQAAVPPSVFAFQQWYKGVDMFDQVLFQHSFALA